MSESNIDRLTINVNGTTVTTARDATVNDVVLTALAGKSSDGIAVAMNGAVVSRSSWHNTPVTAGAIIELVTATQGG